MLRTLTTAARGAGLVAFGLASHAAEDVSGSADPSAIERFPRSWIVEYTERGGDEPYEFITAPVDRISRDVRVEAVRVEGPLARVTYRVPDGTRLDDVIAHYEQRIAAISPGIVFSCRGPDCGRSTIWANHVFGVAELAAPNRNQFYLAAPVRVDGEPQLVAFYAPISMSLSRGARLRSMRPARSRTPSNAAASSWSRASSRMPRASCPRKR